MEVRAKKALGQHFLRDENIAQQIAESLTGTTRHVLEVGPGMGVLTKYLLANPDLDFHAIEIDRESVAYLHTHYPSLHVIEGDFLALNLSQLFSEPFAVIGNFPYNISSQILFKVYDYRDQVPEVVGMFQKEVAERVAARPGSKSAFSSRRSTTLSIFSPSTSMSSPRRPRSSRRLSACGAMMCSGSTATSSSLPEW